LRRAIHYGSVKNGAAAADCQRSDPCARWNARETCAHGASYVSDIKQIPGTIADIDVPGYAIENRSAERLVRSGQRDWPTNHHFGGRPFEYARELMQNAEVITNVQNIVLVIDERRRSVVGDTVRKRDGLYAGIASGTR
jgi:hypothetical protein